MYVEYARPGEKVVLGKWMKEVAPVFVVLAMTLDEYEELQNNLLEAGIKLVDRPKK